MIRLGSGPGLDGLPVSRTLGAYQRRRPQRLNLFGDAEPADQNLIPGETPPDDDSGFDVPVTLTATAVLNPGDAAPMNADALKNPLGVPLRIHELKWVLAATPDSPKVQVISGLAVECSMAVGANAITNTTVPLYNLGPSIDPEAEVGGKTYTSSNFTAQTFGVLKFDEPFYLAPGEGLTVQLKHRSLINSPITVYLSISGTPVCDIPQKRMLPFVMCFTASSITLDPGTTDVLRQSTEQDLVNPLSVPVKCRRMIGRLTVVSTPDANTLYADPNTRHAVRDRLVNMLMRDSQGTPTVKDLTPFGSVFPDSLHSIEIPFVMPPGSYFLASLIGTTMAAADSIKAHPSISIIGYREIQS